ncbi:hypothetical protein IVB40_20960 [Bradyrhizobium sp. 40]|jgi:hypothetical protein|uniref:hypothetical protein n=1 Tax=unclassified Bradyrhizobium TaxID=2631580 RepID=UPI001FF76887|nr:MULTISPECIES: hypothetical protein [unclassified Bradyrhizobium]MCK1364895.1 hypothetical protein [Bradyrhizobium sp. 62]MCK1401631.1 hypothetical protein [Bradyrhizobium sp. 39]MCK1750785.1 hypothetical protein [Bradyrhizobium sp. 135]UPJ39013.1 hypothetical protein IVB45_15105 [Bradyrhizobium sp. 4]UPJ46165.1 hypothetical protein IVB40_20960 [Bradyrhizobium sp. 40]
MNIRKASVDGYGRFALLIFRSATAGRVLFQVRLPQSSGIPNPNDPPRVGRIGDAALYGVTGTIRY